MKILLNGCALAALTLGLVGHAGAQVQVNPAPIHAVPSDADGEQGPLISTTGARTTEQTGDARVVAALTMPAAAVRPVLSPEEGAFFAALGERVTDDAAAYQDYVRAAGAIDARFTSPEQVQSALRTAESYNVAQLQEGAVAYAAVLALRSPAFVEGVRAQGDRGLAERLEAAPDQVLSLPGADEAARDVSNVMRLQARAVLDAGAAISQAAYTVQHQSWSRGEVAEPQKVLALAKATAQKVLTADDRAERRLLDSIGAAPQGGGDSYAPSPEVVQGLALAAVAVLGQAGDAQETRFEVLLRNLRNADCLQLAKMNLNQCLAVAGPQYEDVFCMGRHAVRETGECLSASAGDSPAAPVRTAALDEGTGSERAEAYAQAPARAGSPGD
ncbi:MAG TPA: hypothetical protein VMU59_03290 [Caulobacteraceae bacterium]|nr:hypothetical protein [Caulobacteraceae bacterium]